MAIVIPERPSILTPGERKLFDLFKEKLSSNCVVYYNIPISGYYPDFIIISPKFGIFVLEVKDWKLKNIKSINKENFILEFDGKEDVVKNPVRQVRDYLLRVMSILNRSKIDKNKIKWGCGVVFSNISQRDMDKISVFGSIKEFFGSDFIFSSDDLKTGIIIEKIENMMQTHYGNVVLTNNEINTIRGALYPELLISDINEDIVKILDYEQEKVARSLGIGHYLIRGVAGSGKTVLAVSRAKYLSIANPNWKILFLCYNKTLSLNFKKVLKDYSNVYISTYHSWVLKKISSQGIDVPENNLSDEFWNNEVAKKLIELYDNNKIKKYEYDAIIIDEGQDFSDLWYKTILYSLNPETNSLLIAIDNSQTIYSRKVSWKELGINIIGRTKIFRVNYRNTAQILDYAYSFIKDMDSKGELVYEEGFEPIVPEKALRDGPEVEVRNFRSFEEENRFVFSWAKKIIESKEGKVFILCFTHKDANMIYDYLKLKGVNVSEVNDSYSENDIYILTVHSSKGLECDNVIIYNANDMHCFDNKKSLRLMYIAITRSKKNLCVCYTEK